MLSEDFLRKTFFDYTRRRIVALLSYDDIPEGIPIPNVLKIVSNIQERCKMKKKI